MQKVVILGAGLAGLSAAYHLQGNCVVYEQSTAPGGLARSFARDKFIFDCSGHLLHFKTEYAQNLIKQLMPEQLIPHNRNAWILSHNVYTQYPFQANTFGLPSGIIKKCILGMLKIRLSKSKKHSLNLKDWMVENFGTGITKYFMYPYNQKFWTIAPENLIFDWTKDYVPLVDVKEVVSGAFTLKTKALGYNSCFWYPKTGGIEKIAQAFAGQIQNIKFTHKVSGIDINKKKIYFENEKSTNFTQLISSIPMIELKKIIINDLPARVKEAFSKLKYISVFNLNLGINRKNISDKHWIYFPEDKFCFFRVGFPSNFSDAVAPQGQSSLYAEISYSKFKPLNKKQAVKKICHDLVKSEILKIEDQILSVQVNDIKYAYVIYDFNYHQSLKVINEFLLNQSIYPAGRFGRWKYMSMEDTIVDGKYISDYVKEI